MTRLSMLRTGAWSSSGARFAACAASAPRTLRRTKRVCSPAPSARSRRNAKAQRCSKSATHRPNYSGPSSAHLATRLIGDTLPPRERRDLTQLRRTPRKPVREPRRDRVWIDAFDRWISSDIRDLPYIRLPDETQSIDGSGPRLGIILRPTAFPMEKLCRSMISSDSPSPSRRSSCRPRVRLHG